MLTATVTVEDNELEKNIYIADTNQQNSTGT